VPSLTGAHRDDPARAAAREWGGEIEFVDVSAKTREGLDSLLDTIQVVTDLEERSQQRH